MADDQREVVAFLNDPSSYPPAAGPIRVIETHASRVFLAGNYAYKLKRAVRYSYLDFSTMERRRDACAAELRLNRRTAPQLYLEVRAVSRTPEGRLVWGRGDGEPVDTPLDFVLVMRRFGDRDLLDRAAREGRLSPATACALSAHIAEFHGRSEERPDQGGAPAMARLVADNIAMLRRSPAGFDPPRIDRLEAALRGELERIAPLLDERRAAGKVRRGHGDLHLGNICLTEGRPVLFDCLEFSEDLASIDILYDLAFLLMDLAHRGLRDVANLVLNRYLDLTEEDDGLAALPFFVALRAAIRAHVAATIAANAGDGASTEAQQYLDDAEAALAPHPARLVAVGGISGTGKSSLAARLALDLAAGAGARVLRSDVLRKLMLGSDPEDRLPPEAYAAAITDRVYGELRVRAEAALRAGYPAIIDAVALRPEERASFAALAQAAGVPFAGLWLDAPAETLAARLAARTGDASDATPEIMRQQSACDPGPIDWARIDAAGDAGATYAAARRALMH